MKKLAIISILIISSLFASGTKYWMSSTGAYGNPGTYASPFNWAKGQTLLVGGDTLMFINGTYTATDPDVYKRDLYRHCIGILDVNYTRRVGG